MRKISRFREIVTLVCFVLLLALIVTKVERDNAVRLDGGFRAVDGDSLLSGETRLRLLGIDAPELSQTCMRAGKAWNCGRDARQALAILVSAKAVTCEGGQKDKYGRLLVTCRNGSLDINRQQVLMGMAVSFGAFEAEERQAMAARRGLWASAFMRPSEWRVQHKRDAGREEPHSFSFF